MNKNERKFLQRFGRQIAVRRKGLGLTQKDFAQRINISTAYVASIETGRRWPYITILYSIADALGTTPYNLMSGADN